MEGSPAVDGPNRTDAGETSGEALEVGRADQRPIQARRRDLEDVGLGQRILHVEESRDLVADVLAVGQGDRTFGRRSRITSYNVCYTKLLRSA